MNRVQMTHAFMPMKKMKKKNITYQIKTKTAMMIVMKRNQIVLLMKWMKMDLMLQILPIILPAEYHSKKTMMRSLTVK
jgi:hypothetical protein